jgi:hypothetical protein
MTMDADSGTVEVVCVHRWLIGTPTGEFSRGNCRLCGEVRDFPQEPRSKAAYLRLRER